jgi:hypothetical protein
LDGFWVCSRRKCSARGWSEQRRAATALFVEVDDRDHT